MKKFLKGTIITMVVAAVVLSGASRLKKCYRSIDPPSEPPMSMILPK